MEPLERVIEWCAQYVAAPIAQGAQWINDAMPFSFEDAALAGVVGITAGAVTYARSGPRVRRALRKTALAGTLAASVCGASVGLSLARPDAYTRFSLDRPVMGLHQHYEALRMTTDEGMALEREQVSHTIVPASAVCEQITRFLREEEQPVVDGECATKSSVLFRHLNRRGYATGWFDPLTRDTMLALDASNYWYPFFLGHEMAHRHLILSEDEADFVAYAALSTADGPYAKPLHQVAYLWREKSTQLALAAITGQVFPCVMPQRALTEYGAVSISPLNPTGTGSLPPVTIPEGSSVQEKPAARARFARYDGGYLAMAHAWDVAHGLHRPLPVP